MTKGFVTISFATSKLVSATTCVMNDIQVRRAASSGIKILNRVELASYLGVGERSLSNWERQGLIPVIRLGRRRLYRLDAVLVALEKLES